MPYSRIVNVCSNRKHWHDPRLAVPVVALRSADLRGSRAKNARAMAKDEALAHADNDGYNPLSPRGEAVWLDCGSIRSWPGGPWGKETQAGAVVSWREADALVVGWWEHCADGRKDRGTGNMYNGYLTRAPPRDVALYVYLLSYDHKLRTNMVRLAGRGGSVVVPSLRNKPPFTTRASIPNGGKAVPSSQRDTSAVGEFVGSIPIRSNAEATDCRYALMSYFRGAGMKRHTGTPTRKGDKPGYISITSDYKTIVRWEVNPK